MKLKVPFHKQTNNDCILVCVKMVLEFYGKRVELKDLYRLCNFGKHGSSVLETIKGLKSIDIESYHTNLDVEELKEMIRKRKPVICIINSLFIPWIRTFGFHAVVIIGYENEKIILIDPLFGEKKISVYEFLDAWKIFNNLCLVIEKVNHKN